MKKKTHSVSNTTLFFYSSELGDFSPREAKMGLGICDGE